MLSKYKIQQFVAFDSFDEELYLKSNSDVRVAVNEGRIKSGYDHFKVFGQYENRLVEKYDNTFFKLKRYKLSKIKSILVRETSVTSDLYYNFLDNTLVERYDIVGTDNVSSHEYDQFGLDLIEEYKDGLLLDFGAGKRPTYYKNVVNFEIVPYESTDVCGVGEELPFKDNSFDGVLCIAVLEHVKDPFKCAKEICRVLKPGGKLYCSVPFLQPLHGYPHHYYNMTHQGLRNLFDEYLSIEKLFVPNSTLPIWSLSWMLQSWRDGLENEKTKNDFLNMTVKDLIKNPIELLQSPFVIELSENKNFELASANSIICRKIR